VVAHHVAGDAQPGDFAGEALVESGRAGVRLLRAEWSVNQQDLKPAGVGEPLPAPVDVEALRLAWHDGHLLDAEQGKELSGQPASGRDSQDQRQK
jgi:hypothetical protein